MRVRVTVPASGGNTGPAFDSLGVAYALCNEVILDTDRPGENAIEGEGAEALRQGETNLVRVAIDRFEAETGRKVPPCRLRLVNRIPFGRGLGRMRLTIIKPFPHSMKPDSTSGRSSDTIARSSSVMASSWNVQSVDTATQRQQQPPRFLSRLLPSNDFPARQTTVLLPTSPLGLLTI